MLKNKNVNITETIISMMKPTKDILIKTIMQYSDDQGFHVSDYSHEKINEQDTFHTYNQFSHRGSGRGFQSRQYMSRGSQKLSYPSTRGGLQTQEQTYSGGSLKNILSRRGTNPYDKNGNPMTCSFCESINHFVQNCLDRQGQDIFLQDIMPSQLLPEKQEQNTYFLQEIVLFQSDFDHPAKLRNLVSESLNAAVLDRGATNTVTGENALRLTWKAEVRKKSLKFHSEKVLMLTDLVMVNWLQP